MEVRVLSRAPSEEDFLNKYLIRPWHLYRRKEYFQNYLLRCHKEKAPACLHMGCGDRPISGWLNVDVSRLNREVQFVDARKSLPFDSHTFDYIFSEHFIEHVPYAGGVKFFKEAHRVLKKGGVIRTATPDLRCLIRVLEQRGELEKKYVQWIRDQFYPGRPALPAVAVNSLFYGWGHRMIYDPELLQAVLKEVGFSQFQLCRPKESQWSVLRNMEQHGLSMPSEYNDFETFVLEAAKV